MNRICNPQNYAGLKSETKQSQQQQQQQYLLNHSTGDGIVIQNNEIHYRNLDLDRLTTEQEDIPIPTVKAESIAIYEKYCQMRQSIMGQKDVDPVIKRYVNALK